MSIPFSVRPGGARFALAGLTVALLALALLGASAAQAAGASSPAPLKLTTTSLPPASIGVGYSASLAATGGVGPLQFPDRRRLDAARYGAVPRWTAHRHADGPWDLHDRLQRVRSRGPDLPIATRTLSISVGVVPGVYAANTGANSITEYPLGFGGAVSPVLKIAGAHTGLSAPESLVLDATGKTYVANNAADTVTEYPPGANGQATPMTTITGIASPRALALDSAKPPVRGQPGWVDPRVRDRRNRGQPPRSPQSQASTTRRDWRSTAPDTCGCPSSRPTASTSMRWAAVGRQP